MAAEETSQSANCCPIKQREECSIVPKSNKEMNGVEIAPSIKKRKPFNCADQVDKELSAGLSNTLIIDDGHGSGGDAAGSLDTDAMKQRQSTSHNSSQQQQHKQMNTENKEQQTVGEHSPRGYKTAESPSTDSEGSADSGRATGGLTSSPFDVDAHTHSTAMSVPPTMIPYYEFEIPNSLVGLIIGVGGKTIKELCYRTGVKMLIRPHHTASKIHTHQICSVEGNREDINKCLHMIKGRFPKERFPDLNLKPVIPPIMSRILMPIQQQVLPLTLPVGVPCDVYVSAIVHPGHFFVQLPTHPSFVTLTVLDSFMRDCYTSVNAPELPRPVAVGVICAAPTRNIWLRAMTIFWYEDEDEVLVKFVDYGGYARLPTADLRQIRTDFMTYSMQAIECLLAYVEPIDGTSHWSDEAMDVFSKMCRSGVIQAELVGYSKTPERIPYVVLHFVDENKKVKRIDEVLLDMDLAKMADPTRMDFLKKHSSNSSPAKSMPMSNASNSNSCKNINVTQ